MDRTELPSWLTNNEADEMPTVGDEHRETIVLIFNLYLEGKGGAGITSELNKRRRPTWDGNRQWEPSRIRSLLTDRRLLGEEGKYPAVIETELFTRCQDKLSGNLTNESGLGQITKRVSSCLAPRHPV